MDGINLAGVLRGFYTETRDTFLIEKRGLNAALELRSPKISDILHEECRTQR